ncbi:TPA: hypothetical protein I7730_01640 [Vibrio vulnificus]|uniref:DUF1449 family protein n=1 Tax=Vibrio vulnificus TaxID=672 RepID=A0A8H9MZB7_VIBVL|nr:hypothetical protein [Vibrio vulnificus]HAS8538500.1 hypothetical protein [Vibrio vulnificus]
MFENFLITTSKLFMMAPNHIFGVPFLFILAVLVISALFQIIGALDIDIDTNGDADLGFLANTYVTSGVSKVPLLFALCFVSLAANAILLIFYWVIVAIPFIKDEWCVNLSYAVAPFVLYISLYIVGAMIKPFEKYFTRGQSIEKPITIIGATGSCAVCITKESAPIVQFYIGDIGLNRAAVPLNDKPIEAGTKVEVVRENEDGSVIVKASTKK